MSSELDFGEVWIPKHESLRVLQKESASANSSLTASTASSERERTILQLKICSARKLVNPANYFVQLDFGSWTRQTTVKKHTERPIWNEMFVLPVDNDAEVYSYTMSLMYRDALGKANLIGKTAVTLPTKVNELTDIWVVLDGLSTDVHICMQMEPLGARSLETLVHRNSSRPSLMRFGSTSFKLLTSRTTGTESGIGSPDVSKIGSKSIDNSNFAVRAGAVTLNEICQSLDRLRGVIYLAGSEGTSKSGNGYDVRQQDLQKAKVELNDLADQIDEIEGLSEEWKDKLTGLIEDYSKDCWKMLSDESWANVTSKRVSRPAPPLPSKETRAKLRKDVISVNLGSGGAVSPPPPSVAPPRAPKESPPAPSSSASPTMQSRSFSLSSRVSQDSALPVIIRDHHLSSLEAFDEMMDFGYSLEFPQGKNVKTKSKGMLADIVKCKFTAFVYDGTCTQAVSYDNSGEDFVMFVLGQDHEDVPKGLMHALEKVPDGQALVVVTVTPEWGFGDDGHPKGVPPNSTLVFELRDISFAPGDPEQRKLLMHQKQQHAERSSMERLPDSTMMKTFGTFPAREPEVVLNRHGANPAPLSLFTLPSQLPQSSPPLPPSPPSPPSPPLPPPSKGRKSLIRSFSSSQKDEIRGDESRAPITGPVKPPVEGKTNVASVPSSKPSGKTSAPKSPTETQSTPRPKAEQQIMAELNVRLSRRASDSIL